MSVTYRKELDGVRAIAALMVMYFHFFMSVSPGNAVITIFRKSAYFGQTGVSLFFVLSGFLITRILLETRSGNHYFSSFYARRALRIFPLYYFFLVIYYFLWPLLTKTNSIPLHTQWYYWVYLQNVAMTFNWPVEGPTNFWSLAVEEHFYLFWPLLIFFLNRKQVTIAIISIIVIAIITRFLLIQNNHPAQFFTFSRMDDLAMGALLAILEVNKILVNKNAGKFISIFFIAMIPTIGLWVFYSGEANPFIQVIKFSLLSLCYFSLVGFVLTLSKKHWLTSLLSTRIFSFTGSISYGLYVYHPLAFLIAGFCVKDRSVIISFITSFALTYLIAWLSYHFFESRLLRLKKYFTYDAGTKT